MGEIQSELEGAGAGVLAEVLDSHLLPAGAGSP
jgi:hypothetical protein